MNFYSNWRSLAAYRVRVALTLKDIPHDVTQVDMLGDAHLLPEFRAINPQAVLPALVLDDGRVLFQSMAIVEYLDEIAPAPPLLPADPAGRARVRGRGRESRLRLAARPAAPARRLRAGGAPARCGPGWAGLACRPGAPSRGGAGMGRGGE